MIACFIISIETFFIKFTSFNICMLLFLFILKINSFQAFILSSVLCVYSKISHKQKYCTSRANFVTGHITIPVFNFMKGREGVIYC